MCRLDPSGRDQNVISRWRPDLNRGVGLVEGTYQVGRFWQAGPVQPTRRTVLVAGALSLLSGCRTKPRAQSLVDPDAALRTAALARESALLDAYRAVMARHPALAPQLRLLAADKAVHVAALGAAPPGTSTVTTVAQLRVLERSAATEHGRAAVTASRGLAPLLASLSASSACAAEAL
ncbi:MAG: hypothetical protein JWP14_3328 [Frankiales bacterium]|nr:hypothetical protein [Frankiales bacterium]